MATTFEPDAHQRHDSHGAQKATPQGQSHLVQCHSGHATEHHQLALGEVDDLSRVEDQSETHSGQRVDAAASDPTEYVLKKLVETHNCVAVRFAGQARSAGPKTPKPFSTSSVSRRSSSSVLSMRESPAPR